MINKNSVWIILLLGLISVTNLPAKSKIIDWKELSTDKFNASNIISAALFIDDNNNGFIEVFNGPEDFLWLDNSWVSIKQYGGYLNGFIKNGCLNLAFIKDKQIIDIYSVGKDITFEKRITITNFPIYPGFKRTIIYVPGETNALYLSSSCWQFPRNPIEFMYDVLSGGHGLYFYKPIWAEVQGQSLLGYQKIPYGGNIDESYDIKQVLTANDTIYFFGFRTQQKRNRDVTGILHYAEYDVKKKKLICVQDIYDKFISFSDVNDKPIRNLYLGEVWYRWHVSADNFNNKLFSVFSLQGFHNAEGINGEAQIEKVNSPVYYSQNIGNGFGIAEIIGHGILPLVKADSLGNVHVLWSTINGDIVHKMKAGDKWGEEQIILNNVIDINKVWNGLQRNTCAEFDKDNNLNLIFTSKENLVYTKLKLE